MKTIRLQLVTAAAIALCATASFAQTPAPSTSPSDPSAASSPSQRAATHSNSTESPPADGSNPASASTPAQRDAVKGSKAKMMKDCMAQQSAKNPDMSRSDMTKACNDEMKMHKGAHNSDSSATTSPPK